jgi:archaemetzincin
MRSPNLLLIIFCTAVFSCDRPAGQIKHDIKPATLASQEKLINVGIQPFNDFDTALVNTAVKEIQEFYGFRAVKLSSRTMPQKAWYEPRKRYRADSLLIWLETNKPDSIDYIMGLTGKDISCTNGNYADWGIFGYGYIAGPACVISTLRLKRDNPNFEKLSDRFVKVLLHELGHNIGLEHCPTVGCLMEDANGTIVTVDNEKKELCPLCMQKIKNFVNK